MVEGGLEARQRGKREKESTDVGAKRGISCSVSRSGTNNNIHSPHRLRMLSRELRIDIGNTGSGSDSGTIRIGSTGDQIATFIAGISGVKASGGVEVYINSNGQLGTVNSSRRFKFDIKEIGATSDRLMDLRPVAFRYKEADQDGTHPIQYGLIAEEVAKVYPDLVQYDKAGKPFTVYYHLLTPMMLNELQKAHQQIAALTAGQENQSSEVGSLQRTVGLLIVVVAAMVLAVAAGDGWLLITRTRRNQILRATI